MLKPRLYDELVYSVSQQACRHLGSIITIALDCFPFIYRPAK